jgi:hypothetical protein
MKWNEILDLPLTLKTVIDSLWDAFGSNNNCLSKLADLPFWLVCSVDNVSNRFHDCLSKVPNLIWKLYDWLMADKKCWEYCFDWFQTKNVENIVLIDFRSSSLIHIHHVWWGILWGGGSVSTLNISFKLKIVKFLS